jgi:hypothetical protein
MLAFHVTEHGRRGSPDAVKSDGAKGDGLKLRRTGIVVACWLSRFRDLNRSLACLSLSLAHVAPEQWDEGHSPRNMPILLDRL